MYQRPEYLESNVYHLYNRGVAKLPIFHGPDDYHDFQDILRYLLIGFPQTPAPEVSQTSKEIEKPHLPVSYKADPQSNGLFRKYLDLLAYCLMPNHFHLLIQITNPDGQLKQPDRSLRYFRPVTELMKRLSITYAHKFNHRHQREGALFQGRFRIKHVTSDVYVIQVARYIHLNPTTARFVQKPESWVYGDYHAYITPGSLRYFQITKTAFILNLFNRSPREYQKFVEEGISPDEAHLISEFMIDYDQDNETESSLEVPSLEVSQTSINF